MNGSQFEKFQEARIRQQEQEEQQSRALNLKQASEARVQAEEERRKAEYQNTEPVFVVEFNSCKHTTNMTNKQLQEGHQ